MMYCGIDLHSNNSVVAVIDESDRVVAQRRFANDLARIVAFVARWKNELAGVVVESTYNWYWLVDGVQDAGFRVHLANTVAETAKPMGPRRGDKAVAPPVVPAASTRAPRC